MARKSDDLRKIEFVECRKHLKKSANIYRVNERKLSCLVCALTILVKN